MPETRESAQTICRGAMRALAQRGFATLAEVPLADGRRADILALGRDGALVVVEIKSSVADFRADRKWPEYRQWCDRLYFAVAEGFPTEIIPEECGLILADGFGAEFLREPQSQKLDPARRRAVHLRFARTAGARLQRLTDPGAANPETVI
ncbi:MAG TPA: MmcB family DNA repair protein [Stellaceae bacterium]|nr:MmcB family DNA repair protein [Stellaceae bacterium]